MTETQAEYTTSTPRPERAIMTSFTLDLTSTAQLAELASRTGRSKSALVREAIDQLYSQLTAQN